MTPAEPLLIATRSAGKLRELAPLCAEFGWRVVDLATLGIPESADEEDIESFSTFEENALAKARYFHARSGRPTLADDSGLEVTALDGGPGVRSKRWSGRADLVGDALDAENNRLLLAALAESSDRSARYVCAAAFADGEREIVCRGTVEGRIIEAASGAGGNGFGYDPYFWSSELERTFGVATLEEKADVSHRARAFRSLFEALA
jgi:XTP/dITP diphosphohydrolase